MLRYLIMLIICAAILPAYAQMVTVHPKPYTHALRNPLMGFRGDIDERHAYSQLAKVYIRWNDIENDEADTADKIRAYCDRQWRDGGGWNQLPANTTARTAQSINVKVIPRVYLHWSADDQKYWPADMKPGDNTSDQFRARVLRLIDRLGALWDNDPRVAYIEMGLIGKWGEQHSPSIPAEMQKLLGDAFVKAFRHKLVMVRNPEDFKDYRFGIYWDSFAHMDQMNSHGKAIQELGDRWKVAPIGGETAYDWGNYKTQPGENPTDTVRNPVHRAFLIDTIRTLHANHVGWVSGYDQKDPEAAAGADLVQQALGYRFVLESFSYSAQITPAKPWRVGFTVRNTGSSPFYYNWPMAVCLLDPVTHREVWRQTLRDVGIREWMPGDRWNSAKQAYDLAPKPYSVSSVVDCPRGVIPGEYMVALTVLDPGGNLPALRFSTVNYFTGGYHPMGYITVNRPSKRTQLTGVAYDDPQSDRTLHYEVNSHPVD